MDSTPRALPTGVTAGVLYLLAAAIIGSFLFALTAIGFPAVIANSAVALLAVGFPIAVLLAVILRPEWLRTARQAAAAAFSLSFR